MAAESIQAFSIEEFRMTLKYRQLFLCSIMPCLSLQCYTVSKTRSEFGVTEPSRNKCRHFSGIRNSEQENE